ncbi:class I SAM-dependent methyltransferase [Microbacterium gorillae]|uniref:class I SAM-dependent methyltransferase n=1 Tax=Microbacterium gorillae TaxID=1231063 RepID=UPI00058F0FD3|nr:class I SAM-dependent methyltransferase [Microbacterium gorillae]
MASRDEMSRSFGAEADAYQTGRPEYPAEAVAWLLEPVADRSPRVADVGAGTGKLTRAVLAAGASEVVAIDPDPDMLASLRAATTGVPTHEGTAEALPLPDASVDAVVLGQAWHWVDPESGSAEIGRVLTPGGVLGLIWNIRDSSVPWVGRMGEIMHNSNAEIMIADGGPVVAAPFGEPERRDWSWSRTITRDGLFAMARSRSYLITASDEDRAAVEAELGVLFDEIGAVGEQTVELPYITSAFRYRRAD